MPNYEALYEYEVKIGRIDNGMFVPDKTELRSKWVYFAPLIPNCYMEMIDERPAEEVMAADKVYGKMMTGKSSWEYGNVDVSKIRVVR